MNVLGDYYIIKQITIPLLCEVTAEQRQIHLCVCVF